MATGEPYRYSANVAVAGDDPWPPEQRPEWLRPFTHVLGSISSAPLDMPGRLDAVVGALKAAGWTVDVRSVGTDFAGPLGIPVPKDQPLDMLIHRTDRAYTAAEAQQALTNAINAVSMTYSALGAWMSELDQNIVEPTLTTIENDARSSLPWIVGGGVLVLLILAKLRVL